MWRALLEVEIRSKAPHALLETVERRVDWFVSFDNHRFYITHKWPRLANMDEHRARLEQFGSHIQWVPREVLEVRGAHIECVCST